MRQPIKPETSDTYERPNQTWICALAEEGPPCPVGPTAGGYCSHAVACHPVREGDRWICNRSPLRGGPCSAGPTPEGECCQQYTCTPVRSLRSRRGRLVWALSLATLGGLCMILSSEWRNEFLAPGPLSVHHAQVVTRDGEQTNRCATCHAAGNQTIGQWLSHITESSLAAPSQSELCLECHKKEIPTRFALVAHSVDPSVLFAGHGSESVDRRADTYGPLACSTCHKEHHGAMHDLQWMSDSACQACHREQYQTFATDHPEFANWPEKRRTRIAFDHALHQTKHFPEKELEFSCTLCHQPTENGGFQMTLSYEAACANCHDSDIETSWQQGVPFVSLPMIDTDALREAGHDIGHWPEIATGDFDGALPLTTKFLLLSDKKAAKALEILGADFDFYDVDSDDPQQLAAAADIIGALKEFTKDLAEQGLTAIDNRVERILSRKPSPEELSACVAHLSSENMNAIGKEWFSGQPVETEVTADLVIHGGWSRDDETLVLRYRPSGHIDEWLAAWISLMSQATTGPRAKAAESLLTQIMKPTAPGMCGMCHSVERSANGALEVQWRAKQPSTTRTFSFFSHAPHTLNAQLADCTACHRINESAQVTKNYLATESKEYVSGFHALTKQDCATCHKPGAAGDRCTQCHQYHIDWR